MLDNYILKYTKELEKLKQSKITVVSEMSGLLYKDLIYYNTQDLTLEQCFSGAIQLEFEDNDNTEQDLRSYNYIRDKLYNLLKEKESLGE